MNITKLKAYFVGITIGGFLGCSYMSLVQTFISEPIIRIAFYGWPLLFMLLTSSWFIRQIAKHLFSKKEIEAYEKKERDG